MQSHVKRIFLLALAGLPVATALAAVDVRVGTFNIQTYNASNPQHDAAVAVLQRVDADVVLLQEIANLSSLITLASDSGYTYFALASSSGDIDTGTDLSAVLSKFAFVGSPWTETSATLSGDSGAKDLTRNFIVAVIDVPAATQDMTVTCNHWKAGTGDNNEFRRSIESIRAMQVVQGLDSNVDPFLIMGDMNDDISDSPDNPSQFNSEPSGLPVSFNLGNDISFPVNNSVFDPLQSGTGTQQMTVVSALQVQSQSGEPLDSTRPASGRRLDYVWHSNAVTVVASEVYDSRDEPGGLPKTGSPPASSTSATASDHLLVFADIQLDAVVVVTGACCQPGGTCDDTGTQADCAAVSGHYYGDGTDCQGVLDPICEPPGACCTTGGACLNNQESFDCLNAGGIFYGAGTDCAGPLNPPCTAPGACCETDGSCREDLNTNGCAAVGGFFYGPGTTCAGQLDPPCAPLAVQVIINEVLASHDGTDDQEFVELLGTPFGPLTGMSLLVVEGQTASKGIVKMVVDLTGQQIGGDGYFLMGDAAVSPDLVLGTTDIFENGSETFVLVDSLPGSVTLFTDLDADNDGVAEVSVGTVLDAVGLVGGSGHPDYAIYFGGPEIDAASSTFPAGGARVPNGIDTDTTTEWKILSAALDGSDGDYPITPGAANSGDGDLNNDGRRDLSDFGLFQGCFTGPGAGPPPAGCEDGDMDGDNDVDLADLDLLTTYLDGP